jgi:hypothetical protein
MMKKLNAILGICICGVLMSTSLSFAMSNDDLVSAYQSLSVEQAEAIAKISNSKLEQGAIERGYVDVVPFGGAGGFMAFFPGHGINGANRTQAKGITGLYGGAGGFMVNLNRNWALGGLFGGFSGSSTNKVGANYHNYSVGAGFQMLYGKYKWIVAPKYFIDIDMGLGLLEGGSKSTVDNEQSFSTYVPRDNVSLAGLLGIEARYRITPTWHTGVRLGYFGSRFVELNRGLERDNSGSIDFSGTYAAITMGGNF